MTLLLGGGTRASRARSLIVLAALVLGLLLAQGALGRYQVSVVTTLLLYVAMVSAWNLIGGITGQFSLASSAFVGVGSYAVVLLLRDTAIPLPAALGLAATGGAVFAAVLGLILFRLRGFYFTIGTLAAALATMTWMTTWSLTGGTTGISAPLNLIPDSRTLFLWAVGIAGIAMLTSILVISSSLGLRMKAVRDDEDIADSLGISPFAMKMIAIVISGAITAVAGGMFALQKASVEPFSAFGLDWSITIIVMAIVGGMGTTWGPVVGVIVIYYGLTVQLQSFPAFSALLSGLILIAVIKFLPGGIVGTIGGLRGRLARRRVRAG